MSNIFIHCEDLVADGSITDLKEYIYRVTGITKIEKPSKPVAQIKYQKSSEILFQIQHFSNLSIIDKYQLFLKETFHDGLNTLHEIEQNNKGFQNLVDMSDKALSLETDDQQLLSLMQKISQNLLEYADFYFNNSFLYSLLNAPISFDIWQQNKIMKLESFLKSSLAYEESKRNQNINKENLKFKIDNYFN